MQQHKKSFFEEFSIAFSKQQIWEKCRLLSLLLPRGTPNELHVVFSQICGDVFGKIIFSLIYLMVLEQQRNHSSFIL